MPVEYADIERRLNMFAHLELSTGRIDFQFPPKVPSDSRRGNWKENELQGTEPIANFMVSGPREISLALTYIVDGHLWTTTRIAEIVKKLRGYFAQVRNSPDQRNLIVYFKLWKVGGPRRITCRIKGIDVKHSDTIISPCGHASTAYFLRTDITLDLRVWTKGYKDGTVVQNILPLANFEPPEWY